VVLDRAQLSGASIFTANNLGMPAKNPSKKSGRIKPELSARQVDCGFTRSELRTLRALKTPVGIQHFLDELPYNLSTTSRSPRQVLRDHTASCLEGGIFAAAALRVLGFPPLIFDLEADYDTDHVVAIFKARGHWGAIAKSNFTGCRYREPVYRTLRELALSYFNVYFNLRFERTLRRYSRPVNLARFDSRNWMTTEKPVWFIAEHLCEIPHTALFPARLTKNLTRVDARTVRGEMVGHRKKRGRPNDIRSIGSAPSRARSVSGN
jgi:hypothetical protein